jgi:uncharacterized protein with HEPN domain
MSPDLGHLQDMLSSARISIAHVNGTTLEGFLQDVKMQDAVLWRLAVIGEAANNVTPATQAAMPLPWSQIIGMRHVAIHHYRKLDMRRIWATVNDRLPELAAAIEDFLKDIP